MVVATTLLCVPHLRAWRLHAALSQEALAELAGVSRTTVSSAERGHGVLPSTVFALAKALRIRPHELQRPPAN